MGFSGFFSAISAYTMVISLFFYSGALPVNLPLRVSAKQENCPNEETPQCRVKSCMAKCLEQENDEELCEEECIQYASHSTFHKTCQK